MGFQKKCFLLLTHLKIFFISFYLFTRLFSFAFSVEPPRLWIETIHNNSVEKKNDVFDLHFRVTTNLDLGSIIFSPPEEK